MESVPRRDRQPGSSNAPCRKAMRSRSARNAALSGDRPLMLALASIASRRWRSLSESVSMHHDADHDHHQHRADVGIEELADGDDQFLADAAGADEADHRGAAHIDLEAQHAHSWRSSTAPAAPRRSAPARSSRHRWPRSPPPASCRCSRPPRRTVFPMPRSCEWRSPARRAGRRARTRRRRSARTRYPAPSGRISSRRRTAKRSRCAGNQIAAAQKAAAKREHRPGQGPDIGDQQRVAQQPRPAPQAPEPFGGIAPARRAPLSRCASRSK